MTPEERFERIETIIEKQNAQVGQVIEAAKTLIIIGRTTLDSCTELRASVADFITENRAAMREERENRAHTDGKIDALIDTIDRMIRERREPGERGQP